jgi:ligand-binding sensor domain-containing protein/two-component sensor histidine kinase
MGNAKYQACKFWQLCITFFLLFIFSPFYLKGQEEVLHFQKLSASEGLLSHNYNYYIFKDTFGFVWISSVDGLNRYDGIDIFPFTSDSTACSLADNNLLSKLFQSKDGTIWFGTNMAINAYNQKTGCFIKKFIEEKGSRLKEYYPIYLDQQDQYLWVCANEKLYRYPTQKNGKIDSLGSFDDISKSYVIRNSESDSFNKHIIFSYSSNILKVRTYTDYRLDSIDPITFPSKIISLFVDHEKSIWIGTEQGLFHLDRTMEEPTITSDFKYQGKQLTEVKGIVPYGEQKLIVGTKEKGIYIFNKNSLGYTHQIYFDENGKTEPFMRNVDAMYMDKDSTLWISSQSNGVYFTSLIKKKFKTFLQDYSGKSKNANAIIGLTEDSKKRIWCLTRKGVIVIDQNGNIISQFDKYNNLGRYFKGGELFSIFCDKKDRIWICTNSGLFVLCPDEDGFKRINIVSYPDNLGVTYIYQLKNEDLIVASQNAGVFKIHEGDKISLKEVPELRDTVLTLKIFEDSDGQIFINKNIEKLKIVDRTFKKIQKPIKFTETISNFIEDKKRNVIWLGTWGGLFKIKKVDGSYQIEKTSSFPIRKICGMQQDSLGNFWMSTNKGLVYYDPDTLSKTRIYQYADGLQSNEFNHWSSLKTSSGKLAFGGVNGINIFNPYEIRNLEIKANPTITYFEINNVAFPDYLVDTKSNATNVSHLKNIILEYNQNDLSIGIAPLEYSDPDAIEYYFQITDGTDTIVKRGKNNTFQYPNMQSGSYTLTYNASNSDGVILQDWKKTLKIVIKPPLWKTWWAYILYLLTGIGLIYANYRFRITQIRKEEAFKRKEAEFKQKEAEYKQLAAETETAVLRLQMNPHFIFNSMNSINSYILQKDMDAASDYLHRFARLMRMILKFAAKPLIAISDEIELLELYLQTEAMRFEKKFNYSFDLKDDLDPDEFVIPTMILQPFVENAIWHGLSNKKDGEGMIKVNFWQENESFFCSVEDNGIGRAASSKISRKGKSHESKAISITQHRLQLLENKNGATASFEIQDLKDAAQNPAGTKVVLKFPLL